MAKYSFEFKKKVVTDYLNGKGGYNTLATKYSIPATSNVKKWVDNFNAFGDEGLMRSRKNNSYTFEFKLSVVELYLKTEISYQDLTLSVGINNPSLITKWVNDYCKDGKKYQHIVTHTHPASDGSVPGWEKLRAYTRNVGTPMSVAVILIAKGLALDTGLLIPEYAFKPEDVFEELAKRKILIHEEVNAL